MTVNTTEQIKHFGLKATRIRVAILNLLKNSKSHLSVNDILQKLHKNGVELDEATAYRNLKILCNHNIINRVQLNERKSRYEYAEPNPHYHLICTKCGNINLIDNYPIKFNKKHIEKLTNYKIEFFKIDFLGICPKCQKKLV